MELLNEQFPLGESALTWQLHTVANAHLTNTPELTGTLERLVYLSRETNAAKDVLAGFTLQELLIRLMQTPAQQLIFP